MEGSQADSSSVIDARAPSVGALVLFAKGSGCRLLQIFRDEKDALVATAGSGVLATSFRKALWGWRSMIEI